MWRGAAVVKEQPARELLVLRPFTRGRMKVNKGEAKQAVGRPKGGKAKVKLGVVKVKTKVREKSDVKVGEKRRRAGPGGGARVPSPLPTAAGVSVQGTGAQGGGEASKHGAKNKVIKKGRKEGGARGEERGGEPGGVTVAPQEDGKKIASGKRPVSVSTERKKTSETKNNPAASKVDKRKLNVSAKIQKTKTSSNICNSPSTSQHGENADTVNKSLPKVPKTNNKSSQDKKSDSAKEKHPKPKTEKGQKIRLKERWMRRQKH